MLESLWDSLLYSERISGLIGHHKISLQNTRLHIKLRHTSCKILQRPLCYITGTVAFGLLRINTCDPWKWLWWREWWREWWWWWRWWWPMEVIMLRHFLDHDDRTYCPVRDFSLSYCTLVHVQDAELLQHWTCFTMSAKSNLFQEFLDQNNTKSNPSAKMAPELKNRLQWRRKTQNVLKRPFFLKFTKGFYCEIYKIFVILKITRCRKK